MITVLYNCKVYNMLEALQHFSNQLQFTENKVNTVDTFFFFFLDFLDGISFLDPLLFRISLLDITQPLCLQTNLHHVDAISITNPTRTSRTWMPAPPPGPQLDSCSLTLSVLPPCFWKLSLIPLLLLRIQVDCRPIQPSSWIMNGGIKTWWSSLNLTKTTHC